ncbi:hypothetical protein BH10PAT3_BH10PAT3_5290 [soil metagenome]
MGFGLPLALTIPNISFDEIPNHNIVPVVSAQRAESFRAPLNELVSIEISEDMSSVAEATATAVRLNPPEAPIKKAIELLLQTELDATYNTRQCFIDSEARLAGMYTAEYGGSPGGADGGTASGAYQWLEPYFSYYVVWSEEFYGLRLLPEDDLGRYHAAFAPEYVQDLVTNFAILHPDHAQNITPWTHPACYRLQGTEKQARPDGPEFAPTPFIQAQIDAMN